MLSIFSCASWPSCHVFFGEMSIKICLFWDCFFNWAEWAVCIFWRLIPCCSLCLQIFSPILAVIISDYGFICCTKLVSLIKDPCSLTCGICINPWWSASELNHFAVFYLLTQIFYQEVVFHLIDKIFVLWYM